jgi:hypothetical protein
VALEWRRGRGGDHERRSTVGQLYSDNDEEEVSRNAIEALARETSQPIDEVKQIYEGEFARLRADARITDYLILFASRRTRDALTQRRRR